MTEHSPEIRAEAARIKEPVQALLPQAPERMGYERALCTCARVAYLIQDKFGANYHRSHVWRILDDL